MEHLDGILKLADAELESIIKNGKFRSREEIDSVGKLIDLTKDIHCIWAYEDEESGYDDEGTSYAHGDRRYRDESYRNGYGDASYAKNRRNARRDSMGRYSGNGYDNGRGYRGYSQDLDMTDHLHHMLDEAKTEQDREKIRRWIAEAEKR